ncbi:uncharacterized protein LOC123546506 [Mercenaria mercenaria]|uniref:uncharacterized protein LOC123546506 n=1 Tax=Mercenaria mercenaria TaxID=6596 RepID=UPI00234F5EDB|nr:uncharacterized protein LOC123546506 [Mercenaria mercenaria]
MATITRRGPARTELERMDSLLNNTDNPNHDSEIAKEDISTVKRNTEDKHNSDKRENEYTELMKKEEEFQMMKTPSMETVTPERARSADCDACKITKDINMFLYCPVCKQKLCNSCVAIHNRLGGTRSHHNSTEKCWSESEVLVKSVIDTIMKEQKKNLDQLSSELIEELAIQVCHLYDQDNLELRAPALDVLELATDTVADMTRSGIKSMTKRVRHGAIEWTLRGHRAEAIAKLFKNEINCLIKTYDVVVTLKQGCNVVAWPLQRPRSSTGPNSMLTESGSMLDSRDGTIEMTLRSNFENYYAVDCEIEGLKDEVESLLRAEILRPKQDEFRMKLYTMMKESSDDVICHVEKLENVYKLVIQGQEATTVENVKHEFLSLFCKECSSCNKESSRPTYLDCKHVLCHDCVKLSACLNDGLSCPVCSDNNRQKTPVSSLQLQCIQVIDNLIDTTTKNNRSVAIVRKQSSVKTPQLSTKIPKYLVNKWKKMTGGLSRLKSLIENTYGFKVAGMGENMKIYGQQQEILDLAVQSLDKLNEKTPDTGISQRLAEKCIEWRLRGDHARIAQFLFNQELYELKKKFKTVTVQAFTESEPAIVDVKCGYGEFLKVKYEMEELENDMKNLYTDECVQPKNFYHNVKVKEYLQNKRRDEKVHCTVVEKNNMNVVIIRGRKKEFVNAAKEQLLKW